VEKRTSARAASTAPAIVCGGTRLTSRGSTLRGRNEKRL